MSSNNLPAQRHGAAQRGNTSNLSVPRVRTWAFTLNNHTDNEVTQWHNDILKYKIQKFRMQEEIGENKTPHIQGAVTFKNPVRFKTVKKLLPRAHWEPAKDTKALYKYCRKKASATGLAWEWEREKERKTHGLSPIEINEHMLAQRLKQLSVVEFPGFEGLP